MSDTNLQTQVFEYIKTSVETISDFAAKEVPPFIDEFLRWKFMEAVITASIWVILFTITSCILITWFRKRKAQIFKSFYYDGMEAIPWLMANTIIGIVAICSFFGYMMPSVYTMIQINVAPKVYLLEQASKYFNK